MAIVEVGIATVQVGDSAKKFASASFYVTPANARLYLAAANQAARDATDVGVLLLAALNISRATATQQYKKWTCGLEFINDAFVFPGIDDAIYNSNKWKVTGNTTNAGIPSVDTVYVPEYLVTGVEMESDGISADLDEAPVSAFVTAFLATARSKFHTAFTSVISIQRNDS